MIATTNNVSTQVTPKIHRHIFSIAPMIKCTDRYYRFFARQMTKHALLYTEMLTAPAIINGNRERLLDFDTLEHPIALQLGGSNPQQMTEAARIGEQWGYDEININCGCPSDRVQSGQFGACLMAKPELVAEIFHSIQSSIYIPVTVKTRIGIDEYDDYNFLYQFTQHIQAAGCKTLILHARKAWLQGLSPKQNREIPPLIYKRVYQLKQDFPHLTIIINGGITTLEECIEHLKHVDGVMVGREAYHNPYPLLSQVDARLYNDHQSIDSRLEIAENMLDYINYHMNKDRKLAYLCRHYLGLFQGMAGARTWRKTLSVEACKTNDIQLYQDCLNFMHAQYMKTQQIITKGAMDESA